MDFPEGLKYTHEHEWIRDEGGDIYTVGITEHAAEQLGDVTYVELPEPGMVLDQGQAAGAVESVKAASDIYAPISGHVSEVNQELDRRPEAETVYRTGLAEARKQGQLHAASELQGAFLKFQGLDYEDED